MITCLTCGGQNVDGALFCDECGASLQSPKPQHEYMPVSKVQPPSNPAVGPGVKICSVCGAPAQPGGAFCENCGASLTSEVTESSISPGNLPPTVAIPGIQTSAEVITAPDGPPSPTPSPEAVFTQPSSLTCTNCDAILEPDSAFCDMCGAPVNKAAPIDDESQVGEYSAPQNFEQPQAGSIQSQPPSGQPQVAPRLPSLLQAQLVIHGTNKSLPLKPGQLVYIVGREDPIGNIYPEIDLTDYGGDAGGVSRQHARITLQGNQYYISDLESTNNTYLNQQQLQPNLPTPLHNGDEVQFGNVTVTFYTQ